MNTDTLPKAERARIVMLKAGVLYFVLVFGTGFILGPVRMLWVAPRLGARTAELLEAPVMLTVVFVVARWITRWLAEPPSTAIRLGMGSIALGLMLLAEFTLVLWLRGISIRQYFATRDPIAGTVYYIILGAFAVMPLLLDNPRHSIGAGGKST